MNKILVATDFSPAAEHALSFASMIAQKSGDVVTLFHVINSHTGDLLEKVGKSESELDEYLGQVSEATSEKYGIVCEYKTRTGSIFTDINHVAADPEYRMIVMGTHGTKGIRQTLFGADILKIARKAPVPLVALPDNADLDQVFSKIIFPYGGHRSFKNKITASAMIAELFNSEIHLFSVDRDGVEIDPLTRDNVSKAREYFNSKGIHSVSVTEKMNEFSIGFAHQTIEYAKKVNAKIIAVMSTSSKQMSFISDVDKESLINNQDGLAILMTGDY